MKIIEKDEQRMVIGRVSGRFMGRKYSPKYLLVFFIFLTIISLIVPITLFNVFGLLVGILGIIFTVFALKSAKIVIDKPSQTVTIERRLIPFSDVRSVVIKDKTKVIIASEGMVSGWYVSLYTSNKQFRIDFSKDKGHLRSLANEISSFIGKELIDESTRESADEAIYRLFNKRD